MGSRRGLRDALALLLLALLLVPRPPPLLLLLLLLDVSLPLLLWGLTDFTIIFEGRDADVDTGASLADKVIVELCAEGAEIDVPADDVACFLLFEFPTGAVVFVVAVIGLMTVLLLVPLLPLLLVVVLRQLLLALLECAAAGAPPPAALVPC